jgi:hypothetical protein
MEPHEPTDSSGCALAVGDLVRVVGVPDLSGMAPASKAESLPVFQHIIGRYYRIDSFDELGFAWLHFRIRSGPSKGTHGVAIEPFLVRKRRPRDDPSKRQAAHR